MLATVALLAPSLALLGGDEAVAHLGVARVQDAAQVEVCDLLTLDQIERVVGVAVGAPELDQREESATCSYVITSGTDDDQVEVDLGPATMYQALHDTNGATVEGEAEDLSGLGDAAFWSAPSSTTYVLIGDLLVRVTVQRAGTEMRDESIELAKIALDALQNATAPAGPTARVSAAKWVKGFCTALVDWSTDTTARNDEQNAALEALGAPATPDTAKLLLVGYLGDIADMTQRLSESIEATGVPKVPNGAKLATTLTKKMTASSDGLRQVYEDSQRLPIDDATVFNSRAATVASDFESAMNDFVQVLGDAEKQLKKSPKIKRALRAEPACK